MTKEVKLRKLNTNYKGLLDTQLYKYGIYIMVL